MMRGDEHEQTARPHLVERGGEEIIVDGKFVIVPTRVMDGVIAKGNIGDGQVERFVRQF